MPDSFVDFQEMKYNDGKEWNKLKEIYRDVNWQTKSLKSLTVIEEHKMPYQHKPDSVVDNYKEGKLMQRRFYGKTGKPKLDLDMPDHGNSKEHPVVPHYHNWNEINDKTVRDGKHDNVLKLAHKIANKDILGKD